VTQITSGEMLLTGMLQAEIGYCRLEYLDLDDGMEGSNLWEGELGWLARINMAAALYHKSRCQLDEIAPLANPIPFYKM